MIYSLHSNLYNIILSIVTERLDPIPQIKIRAIIMSSIVRLKKFIVCAKNSFGLLMSKLFHHQVPLWIRKVMIVTKSGNSSLGLLYLQGGTILHFRQTQVGAHLNLHLSSKLPHPAVSRHYLHSKRYNQSSKRKSENLEVIG
mmetsp:Transcript_13148/g.32250  ORF Transcript_13148/g.32250 Transcript_13148/m.32250 type:complete len:142 (-) Transcript_13148:777-1202(-)